MQTIERSIEQLAEDFEEELKLFCENPMHNSPRCSCCGRILHSGRLSDTGAGHYADTLVMCAWDVAARNERLAAELKESAEGERLQ